MGALLESSSSAAVEEGVTAVATEARHTRPDPGQCRCACESSINFLTIDTRTAAAYTVLTCFSFELLKGRSASPITKTHNQHWRNPYCCTRIPRSPAMPVKSHVAAYIHSFLGACENTRCRTCLDEFSTAYSETSSRRVGCHLVYACTGPVGTDLGAVYVECGAQTWPKKM